MAQIDWSAVGDDVVAAMKGVLQDKGGQVAALAAYHAAQIVQMGQFIAAQKGSMDPDVYRHLLDEQAGYIKANIGGLEGVSSVVARQAANAGLAVLVKALNVALGLPLLALV